MGGLRHAFADRGYIAHQAELQALDSRNHYFSQSVNSGSGLIENTADSVIERLRRAKAGFGSGVGIGIGLPFAVSGPQTALSRRNMALWKNLSL